MTGKVREVPAHLPDPGKPGSSLCGEVTRIVRCQACDRRREALIRVHIQSPRRPGKAFCGVLLSCAEVTGVTDSLDLPMLHISAERARDVMGDPECALPICPGCSVNMERFDEASARKRLDPVDDEDAPVPAPRRASSAPDLDPSVDSPDDRSAGDGEDYDD